MRVFTWDVLSLIMLLLSTVTTSTAIDHHPAIASVDLQLLATLLPFSISFFGSPTYGKSVTNQNCYPEADIIFLVDSSGSIDTSEWQMTIKFMEDTIRGLHDSNVYSSLRFAAVAFSDHAEVVFDLNDHRTIEGAIRGLKKIPHHKQWTNIADAFRVARLQVLHTGRSSAAKVMILLSDGIPNREERWTERQAIKAKDLGVHVVSIGIGLDHDHAAKNLLRSVDSSPADALFTPDFIRLHNRVSDMVRTACPQPDLQGLSCSFEPGTSCKWGNLKTSRDPLQWKVVKAENNGWTRYAKQDHTTGSSRGFYAYLNANKANAGSKGTLKSPTIKAAPGNGMCLTFWYNMFDTFGRFTVDMIPQGETQETLFVLDGNQGNVWHQAKVALVSDVPFQVYLTHTRGEDKTETGLAIDDVQVNNAPCLATPLACGQTKYHSRSKRDLTSVDFEKALKDLEKDVGDLENFVRDTDDKNLTKRIISGEMSRQGEWPWIVQIRNYKYGISAGSYGQCGGTLIHPKWILSAAHCFEGYGGKVKNDPNNVMLHFGEHNIRYSSIEKAQFAVKPAKIILHPNRNKSAGGRATHRFDLAMIKLKAPVTVGDYINVACLPDGPTPAGTKCVAAGWGRTGTGGTSDHLLHITKQVVDRRLCWYTLFEDQICAIAVKGYGDVCKGDSGGPLMCKRSDGKYEVIGAVSWGSSCAKKKRTPGIYANVHHAMSWIQTTMGNND